MTVATAPARRNVHNSVSMTDGRSLRKTAARRVPSRANPNANRSAFKTGNNRARNPGRNRVSHRAPNASRKARRSRSSGNSKRNHSRFRRCRPARPAMLNPNRHVRNPAAETSKPAPVARKFRPPTRARSLVEDDGDDGSEVSSVLNKSNSDLELEL